MVLRPTWSVGQPQRISPTRRQFDILVPIVRPSDLAKKKGLVVLVWAEQ
jgi:hypothetical protein